jgi:hypothetical protein
MNKSLESYFDNTKQLHLLLTFSLLIIIVTIGIPEEFKYTKGIGQGIAISILSYILYKNYNETYNLQLIQKDLKEKLQTMNSQKLNKKEDDNNNNKIENENEIIDMKNNTIASYTLCGFIGILLLYFIYSIFF